jgi:tetratricopeptide (TPR) repeat protein
MVLSTIAARRQRYGQSKEWVESNRRALAISLTWNEPGHIAWSRFGLGFALLWNGGLDEAEQQMQAALLTAQQRGDVVHQARCLTYITLVYRRRGNVAEAVSYAQRSLQAAENAHTTEYVGTAHANLAWVAWQRGEQAQAKQHALQAIDLWATLPKAHGSCAFQWTALMPLMALHMAQSEMADAIKCARVLLDPAQQQLPALLSGRLTQAISAYDAADLGAAQTHLTIALDLARRFAYL